MIEIRRKQDCCGCTACEQVCGRKAITMQPDGKGFMYPVVDKNICNDCNLCIRTCPIINEGTKRTPNHTYAVKNKNIETRLNSSSGGVFSIFAKETISRGGIVFGATFDDNWRVVHTSVNKFEDIHKFQGSKYVQSEIRGIYAEVKKLLRDNKIVLFSGTPCQVGGLLSFLGKKYENLTTIDFVCHGVPNPRIWDDYLKEKTTAHRAVAGKSTVSSSLNPMSSIRDIRFRDKSNGWKKFRFVLELAEASAEGKESSVLSSINEYCWDNDFMSLFLNDYINRPSCFECHFRNGKSGSDYTMADFWCIENFYEDFFDDNGVSMLLSYNEEIPQYIKTQTENIKTKFEEACYGNRCIRTDWPYKRITEIFYLFHDTFGLNIHKSLVLTSFLEKKKDEYKLWYQNIKGKLRRIRQKLAF